MSTTIESLELQIQSSATSATNGIDALSTSLSKLKNSIRGDIGLNSVANQVRNLDIALKSVDGGSADKIDRLSNSLSKLSNMGKLKISASIGNQIKNIASAVSSLNTADFSSISRLSSSLKPLGSIESTKGLQSVLTQLKKLPEIASSMKAIDWNTLESQFNRLATSLIPLSNQLAIVGNAFSNLPTKIQRLTNVSSKMSQVNNTASMSYVNLWAKFMMGIQAVRIGSRVLGGWITQSNKYVEDLNLFTASMGEYAQKAQTFAERVSEAMGIDPAEWMRNQGVFNTIITGFGVASDRAYTMSKNLTQLGYDLSSFFNISFQDSMQKLSSGIAGELEPLRRLGYDLSVARLQQEAYNLGINRSINSMTQAEKAQLRYYAIMTQVTVAQGDMARTLNAPANQLRVLQAQAIMTARALGNIFIPALNTILPYAIAFIKVIRTVANAIASLFHFKLPEIDYSSIKQNIGGVAKGLDNAGVGAGNLGKGLGKAAKKAKELKNHLLGIDELNIISEDMSPLSGAGGGGGIGDGGVGGGDGLDFELPEYNFLDGLIESKVNKIFKKMKKHLDEILVLVGAIGAGLLAWKVSKTLLNSLEWMTALRSAGLGAPLLITIGATLLITGVILEWGGIKSAIKHGLDKFNFGEIIGGGILQSFAGFALGKGIAKIILKKFSGGAIASALTKMAANLGVATAETAGGIFLAGVMAIIAGIPMYIVGVYDAFKRSLNWLNGTLIPMGSSLAGAGIGAIIGSLGGPIGAGIGALIGLAIGLITDGIIAIVEHWGEITKFVKNFFTVTIPNIWNGFVKWVKNLPTEISTFFSNLWKPIKEYDWYGLGKKVGKWFGSAIKSAIDFVTVTVPNWFKNLWTSIKTGFKTFFTQTLPQFFTETIPDTVKKIGDWFEGLPEAIYNAVKKGWKWLNDVGKAIIDGIVEGFKSIGKAIKDFVDGFVEGIKEGLGIHSPSTVFMEIAGYCIEGLFKGLLGGIKNIGKWVKKNIITPISNAIKNNPVADIVVGIANKAKDWWNKAKKWWKDTSKDGVSLEAGVKLVKKGWNTVKNWIGKIPIVSQAISLIKSGWQTVKTWVGNIPVLSQFISLAKSGWSRVTSWVRQFITGNVGQKISLMKGAWSSVSQWVRDRIGGAVTVAVNLTKGWVSGLTNKARKWLGLSTGGYITGSGIVHQFADGGIIGKSGISYFANGTTNAGAHGSMFVAGENGAEMVGHINGQTEVLNRSQISMAMRSAVISGMAQFTDYWRNLTSQMVICTNAIIRTIMVNTEVLNAAIATNTSFDPTNSLAQSVCDDSQRVYSNSTSNENIAVTIRDFYIEYVEPTLKEIAHDTKKQADKEEQTLVQIGTRTITDAVVAQQKANGFSFVK